MRFTPAKGELLTLSEYGKVEGGFVYHEAFSQGGFVYDPRFSSSAVPLGDYLNQIGKLNPRFSVTLH